MIRGYSIFFIAVALVLCGCATIYNPATGQKEFIFITTPTEVAIGNTLAAKVAAQYKISKDRRKTSRLTEIGKKIASVSDRKDLTYNFYVIEDKELNAFTTPGGHVYVSSGLMEKASEDELACVIGHEVGHVAARHIAKKLQAQLGYDILMNIATRKGGLGDLQKAASLSYNLMMLGYSREDELLSDRLGVKYAYKARYDPYAMISFLKKLNEEKGSNAGPVFLRSHPYVSQRIKMLEMQISAIIERVDKKTVATTDTHTQVQKQNSTVSNLTSTDKPRPRKLMCPECRRIFPGSTRYCPYDGTKL